MVGTAPVSSGSWRVREAAESGAGTQEMATAPGSVSFWSSEKFSGSSEKYSAHHSHQGWMLGGTKCYWVSTGYGSWNRSQEDCGDRGAKLLLPWDRDELEVLNETLQKPGRRFWVGLWVPSARVGWTWLNGSRLDRHRFHLDPRETPGFCGTIRGSSIVSQECNTELQWICQREAAKF
ncbi:killer cell lectin-like receptor subfamily B member 1B allele A [Malurus melanocephalus]|uniref:killer cell lectin-like receptor subfamily B member 1B allele A n=1 Tax=Malurus melanocephalus TaxID=175006 RepID=UPI002546591F|nr:killer cell lectin-like receptor subfamily B member 1B allele A [Malurus melanocephalus]